MEFEISIPEIEARLKAAGIGINEFCAKAQIHRASWQRWKSGRFEPRHDAWKRVIAALPPAPDAVEAQTGRVVSLTAAEPGSTAPADKPEAA